MYFSSVTILYSHASTSPCCLASPPPSLSYLRYSCSSSSTQSYSPQSPSSRCPRPLIMAVWLLPALDWSSSRKEVESVLCLSLQNKLVTLPSSYIPRPTFFVISSPTPPPPRLLLDLRTPVDALEKGASSSGWMQPHARLYVL